MTCLEVAGTACASEWGPRSPLPRRSSHPRARRPSANSAETRAGASSSCGGSADRAAGTARWAPRGGASVRAAPVSPSARGPVSRSRGRGASGRGRARRLRTTTSESSGIRRLQVGPAFRCGRRSRTPTAEVGSPLGQARHPRARPSRPAARGSVVGGPRQVAATAARSRTTGSRTSTRSPSSAARSASPASAASPIPHRDIPGMPPPSSALPRAQRLRTKGADSARGDVSRP